jgi:hypothetical protein
MVIRRILTVLFLAAALTAPAQTIAEAFRKVNETYSKTPSISMQVHYRLFSDYTATVPFESNDGVFFRNGNSFYSSLLGITTVQNKNVRISVSENDKTIIVSDPSEKGKNPSTIEIDSMLARCSSSELRNEENGSRRCILFFDKSPFSEFDRIEILIGSNNFVTKIILFYREAVKLDETIPGMKKEKPRLEISYSDIDTSPSFPENKFSEKPFVQLKGKEYSPSPAYSAYRILNHKK